MSKITKPVVAFIVPLVLSVTALAQSIVINELHYHPSNSVVAPEEDAEDLQFLELYNADSATIDLGGWSMAAGVEFVFPGGTTLDPGEFLVLAENEAFLRAKAPSLPMGTRVLEWADGALSNSGELIQLVDDSVPTPVVINQVEYDDVAPWPEDADGFGPSLELVNPGFDNAFPLVWRASAEDNGTPGTPNSTFSEDPIIISETPARSSVVPTLTEVSVTFAEAVLNVLAGDLTVNYFAATTVVCDTCSNGIGPGPYVFSGFPSPVVSPVQVELATGTIQDPQGNPFAGDLWVYSLDVPCVIINELHYNPDGIEDPQEFIELYNAEADAVDISNWTLTEFASPGYIFPMGTVMPAGEFVVIAKSTDALLGATGCETSHQWSAGDSLSNAGEPVRLANQLGIVIDRVVYSDDLPWPTAPDGDGPSLELLHPDFANECSSTWAASLATDGTPGAQNSVFSSNPVVLTETPARRSLIESLSSVSVTFAEPVTGVAAGDLTVNGLPATGVVGQDEGPYVFTVVGPDPGMVDVVLDSGAIADLGTNAFAGDAWQYVFGLPDIVINELHYHPADSAVEVGEDPENLQFLELYNADSNAVDLSGWSISDGVDFVFPEGIALEPGEFLVVAKNAAFLESKIPSIPPEVEVLQWIEGNLGNGGERVAISESLGNLVDEVSYTDDPPWPLPPDGNGPSLELLHPDLPNDLAESWSSALNVNGTPGAANSVYDEAPFVLLTSPSRGAVILSLGSVSVTFSEPVSGVQAGDLTVDGSSAGEVTGQEAGPYEFSGFNQPSDGLVTVVLDSGAIVDVTSNAFAGDTWQYTFDLANIVINELHYHPADSAVAPEEDPENLQFLELHNADSNAVDLSGWLFCDGLTYVFPADTLLAAGEFLVVAKDAAFLQAQVSTIPPGVQVHQWESGNLANGGERVALADNLCNIVDQVTYDDRGNWPEEADGDGPSLELINPELPNELGITWRASSVTNGTPGQTNSVFETDPAPLIAQPLHSPTIPAGNASVTITATVLDNSAIAPVVTLFYRQDQNPTVAYSSTAMFDDGLHGDGGAGDSMYGVTVSGLPDGERLDFYIFAEDDNSNGAVAPPGHETLDVLGNPSQTFLCKFSDDEAPSGFPVYHFIVTEANRADQEVTPRDKTEYDATFIDDHGNIFYNVQERYRGQTSLDLNPPSYRVNFNADQPLESEMGFSLTRLQLMGQNPARQSLGYEVFADVGIPTPTCQFVRLIINPTLYPFVNTHVYANMERIDEDFLSRRFDGGSAQGNLYRGRNDGDFRWEGPTVGEPGGAYRTDEDGMNGYDKSTNETEDLWDDLITLCDALTCAEDDGVLCYTDSQYESEYVSLVESLIDVDEWALFFALHIAFGNQEGGIYRDTGDDYYAYFFPDPGASYPDLGNYNTLLFCWDLDSVLIDPSMSLWRTTVPAVQRLLQHNAFAPIYVKAMRDLLDNEFSQVAMNARIDALPDEVADANLKETLKVRVQARHVRLNNQIVDELTVTGIPDSPYTDPDPMIYLSGTLNQAGTHSVLVNDVQADLNVYEGTWSCALELVPGEHLIVVSALGRYGVEMGRIEHSVTYDPPWAGSLRMTSPRRMVNTKTLTLTAEVLDSAGDLVWQDSELWGTVSAARVSDRSPVPTSITVFDSAPDRIPEPDSICFYNGVGSVSITLDNGVAEPEGYILVSVSVGYRVASTVVKVLDESNPVLFRERSGNLLGAHLIWGPGDGVIRITGPCTVPSGETLTIKPGTLIMVDTTGSLDQGTLITVNGNVQAVGSRDLPIYFFPTNAAEAMVLPQEQASNANSWRGIRHCGAGASSYGHVFVCGAGNGASGSYSRPWVLRFEDEHSVEMTGCVLVDNPGLVVSGSGSGSYTLSECVVSRDGFGAEFSGAGHTLVIEDSWWAGCGWAEEPRDGDLIYLGDSAASQVVRRSIFADGGGDGINCYSCAPLVENCIIHSLGNNAVSLHNGGTLDAGNLLMFDCGSGIWVDNDQAVTLCNCTLAGDTQLAGANCTTSEVERCIIWSTSYDTCCGSVAYTLIGDPGDLGCGEGNLSADPQYVDPVNYDYTLLPTSPAASAGPNGEQIGWRGFPAAVCSEDSDCDDDNACTVDVCVFGADTNGVCAYTQVPDCVPCSTNADCADGNPCTVGTCMPDNTCFFENVTEGDNCDDGDDCTLYDACSNGICVGEEVPGCCMDDDDCDDGIPCSVDICSNGTCTHDFISYCGAGAGTELSLHSGQHCYGVGDTITISIELSGAVANITGGQFSLEYEVTRLGFVSIEPGDPPFSREVYSDPSNGTDGIIHYAVGVPGGDAGATDGVVAVLTFTAIAEVCGGEALVWFRPHAPPNRAVDGVDCEYSEALGNLILTNLGKITIDVNDCAGPFDADYDGDVDLTDCADFVACLSGVGIPATGLCQDPHDSDGDTDVDLIDFAEFQAAFTGSCD
ncbi:MAG: lamin tail domain-containing protein [Phycisphaerae bacterium]|nr:lamin tail domain-containing protein [Phycisphaerae bacterium]